MRNVENWLCYELRPWFFTRSGEDLVGCGWSFKSFLFVKEKCLPLCLLLRELQEEKKQAEQQGMRLIKLAKINDLSVVNGAVLDGWPIPSCEPPLFFFGLSLAVSLCSCSGVTLPVLEVNFGPCCIGSFKWRITRGERVPCRRMPDDKHIPKGIRRKVP